MRRAGKGGEPATASRGSGRKAPSSRFRASSAARLRTRGCPLQDRGSHRRYLDYRAIRPFVRRRTADRNRCAPAWEAPRPQGRAGSGSGCEAPSPKLLPRRPQKSNSAACGSGEPALDTEATALPSPQPPSPPSLAAAASPAELAAAASPAAAAETAAAAVSCSPPRRRHSSTDAGEDALWGSAEYGEASVGALPASRTGSAVDWDRPVQSWVEEVALQVYRLSALQPGGRLGQRASDIRRAVHMSSSSGVLFTRCTGALPARGAARRTRPAPARRRRSLGRSP